MRISDWSSDVCSSDLGGGLRGIARIACLAQCHRAPGNGIFNATHDKRFAQFRHLLIAKSNDFVEVMPGIDMHQGKRKPTRSEEHTSELQSLMRISYAVFCLKKKTKKTQHNHNTHT